MSSSKTILMCYLDRTSFATTNFPLIPHAYCETKTVSKNYDFARAGAFWCCKLDFSA